MLQKLKNCFILIFAFAAVCVSAAVKEMKMGVYILRRSFPQDCERGRCGLEKSGG